MIAVFALCLTLRAQTQRKTAAPPPAKPPAARNEDPQLYRNLTFAFRFQIPYGWVDRTKEMQEGNEAGKAEVLLAIFERPPQATGDTINSAVVIASESTASYPGLTKVQDYLGPLTELATSKGFKPEGEPYPLEVESRHLLRADFTKPLSAWMSLAVANPKLWMDAVSVRTVSHVSSGTFKKIFATCGSYCIPAPRSITSRDALNGRARR